MSAPAPAMLDREIGGPRAWRGAQIGPRDWTVPLPAAAHAELDAVVTRLRADPLPTLLLRPDDFALAACAEAMRRARRELSAGIGLAVLDRVDADRYSVDELRTLSWLLGNLLGRVVAGSWDGAVLYDVRDTGRTLEYGVRRSVTRLDLTFHTDGPWLERPPETVGLTCVHPAREGGLSRFVSLATVHDELRRRYPRLLPRLYRPFPWDRQAEHAPGEPRTARQPVFRVDGTDWIGAYNTRLIQAGAELEGAPLDAEGAEALAVMDAVIDDPELGVEFLIERGQIQLLGNRWFAHSRSEFRDGDDPATRRHLIRFWTREEGGRGFHA